MQVISLTSKKQLKKFIELPFTLYKEDKCFVPQISSDLYKTLIKLCLKDKTYTALAVVDKNGNFPESAMDYTKFFSINRFIKSVICCGKGQFYGDLNLV